MDNSAEYGGGVYCHDEEYPILESCVFTGNSAGEAGGGIAFDDAWWPTVTDCVFTGNTSQGSGGAVYGYWAMTTFDDCTFTNNSSADGGVMYCGTYANITMNGCTLFANRASNHGAGLFVVDSYPTVRNSIVAYSTDGEAVYSPTRPDMVRSRAAATSSEIRMATG